MTLQNVDHLFNELDDIEGSPHYHPIAAPYAYWLNNENPEFFQSGGPMIINPQITSSREDTRDMIHGQHQEEVAGEMDWMNAHYHNDVVLLHGLYALLIGEWMPGDGVFKHWQQQLSISSSDLKQKARMVHFIAGWKPWRWSKEQIE